jgi:hypothetical protein
MTAGAIALATVSVGQASTVKDVDLVFVIDRSGSMDNEGQTLSDRIGEVLTGLEAAPEIGTAQAAVVSYLSTPSLVSGITGNVTGLQTAIDGITYSGSTERGLAAMNSVLPGGSLFGSIGYRSNTVRSIVLLTDEDADDPGSDYASFTAALKSSGYLNNVIVSNQGSRCQGLGGSNTGGGCEYIPTANPSTGAFDLVDFTANTDTFLKEFIAAKIGEVIITPPPNPTPTPAPVPLPAAGWMLLAALGGLGFMRRRASPIPA